MPTAPKTRMMEATMDEAEDVNATAWVEMASSPYKDEIESL
jgi:hypothetical protein